MTESISSSIDFISNISVALPILGILAMAALALFVWNRTKSSYSLMNRLWQLFHGNNDCKDKEISEFLDAQSALMQFRFTTGIPIRTGKHAKAIIDWAHKNNQDISDIAGCGPYFDIENIKLKEAEKLPNNWLLGLRFAGSMILSIILISFAGGAFLDRAILQIKGSGTYFTMSHDYANFIGSSQRITSGKCTNSKVQAGNGFEDNDTKIICEFFNDKNLNSYLDQTINTQKIVFGFCFFPTAYLLFGMFNWLRQGVSAWRMSKLINTKKEKSVLSLTDNDSA